ncbi:unnamed protein product, partial [Ixodes pacificus]
MVVYNIDKSFSSKKERMLQEKIYKETGSALHPANRWRQSVLSSRGFEEILKRTVLSSRKRGNQPPECRNSECNFRASLVVVKLSVPANRGTGIKGRGTRIEARAGTWGAGPT